MTDPNPTQTTRDGHYWNPIETAPDHEIIVGWRNGSTTRRVRRVNGKWMDAVNGWLLTIPPVRWRYMIEELDI